MKGPKNKKTYSFANANSSGDNCDGSVSERDFSCSR